MAEQTPADRELTFDGLLNVRDAGGLTTGDGRQVRPGMLVRADNLRGLTDAGAAAFVKQLQPRLVLDLRTEQECGREGRGLAGVAGVAYVNVPLQPMAALTPAQVAEGLATSLLADYVLQVERNGGQLVSALRRLAQPGALPAVVHCTAGKDRTGVLVALLLDLLGVEREQVVSDYAHTTVNMPGILDRIRASPFFRSNGLAEAPAWIFESDAGTMREFLAWLDDTYGGTRRWAVGAGLTEHDLAGLQRLLTEP